MVSTLFKRVPLHVYWWYIYHGPNDLTHFFDKDVVVFVQYYLYEKTYLVTLHHTTHVIKC